MTEISYRLAVPDDVPTINAVAARSIRALHKESYDDAIINAAIEQAYGVDWQLVRDGTYFVAEMNGDIAGAGGWSHRETIAGAHGPDDLPGAGLNPMHDAARIRAFYVDPAFARRGVGARLLRLSEDAARSAGFKKAELTSTLPAVPFYSRFGYNSVGVYSLPLNDGLSLTLELMTKLLAIS
ncbi:GNAT family N-acetyltransferase [Rhizobium ruizarguesonis]|jgi:GNAT superfamily N-acetyltransferase|uniref:GNAT family N-acetyltransferase n=1 Tax=Rhizobium ruizarguesonis TaxID=2081791 RepID=UPI00102FF831|nr:GNAT family N-acetyltransferase [Rhizobium ruizarguesonis]NEH75727.1 GNAT family N-acetyltransferase [Rhizobium ruizarguesonis]NEJ85553.1 GNAT family N-acetyltransferase [Rhizobium ruizarguesonis]NEJ93919.1 GNAT family N-acetyltransferase [Rhizobium ruizarguesonis]TAT73511.1 GNAT family N-acetyltransferase [Rhizobium ruizarguesonis]TAT74596.1 GNAT family N-acetyltransferase [Rhizobium ruizarguesonis]